MRDQMKKGQLAFFYHSNCKTPGIAGIVEVKLYKTYKNDLFHALHYPSWK